MLIYDRIVNVHLDYDKGVKADKNKHTTVHLIVVLRKEGIHGRSNLIYYDFIYYSWHCNC